MGTLAVARHAESEWNLLGKWTGLTDVGLTDKGKSDARKQGELLQGMKFDAAYTSALRRTHETLDHMLAGMEQGGEFPHVAAAELNERDYGELTGKNKWEVQAEIGDEAFAGIRRGWDYPVPGGETLKDVYDRVLPFFEQELLPRLQSGKNILLVAHGNSIRALMKHLDHIAEDRMAEVEMPFGQVLVYTFDAKHALPVKKEVRQTDITATHA